MTAAKRAHGAKNDVDLDAEALRALAARFLEICRERTGQPFPADPLRAAAARDRGGVPLVERQARDRLPPPVPDHQGHGERHRGQRRRDGVRQSRRRLGDRSRLHAQSRHRRERHLRRVPRQRAGRGRRRRHPHAEADRRDGGRDAGAARAARHAPRQARIALQGSAGLRIHDRARPSLLPADAQRQDERACDGRDVRRDVRAGPDQPRAGARADQSDAAGAAARADARPASTRRPRSRRGSRPRRARRPAPSSSTPTPPSSAASTGTRSSSSARRRSPRTSTGSSRRRRS